MSEELNPGSFDLLSVLSGREYPTLEVPVYFNEKLGFAIHELTKMLTTLTQLGETGEVAATNERLATLVEQAQSEKYVLTLKQVPEGVRRDILNKSEKKFPTKRNLLGQPEANPEGDEYLTILLWDAYIQTITAPDGAINLVGEPEVRALFEKAPSTVHQAINQGLQELQNGSKAGYEFAAKEIDFLSDASPEG